MVSVNRVEYVGDYRLRLALSDGAVGEVALADDLWGEIFDPLRDTKLFREVTVDPELGTT